MDMRQITCAGLAIIIATALACSPRDRQETANRTEEAAQDVGDAAREGAEEVREEARDARDYAYAQRADFRRDIDLRLQGIDAEIAQLERDTKRGADKARDSAIAEIRTARKAVNRDLERLGAAAESNWDELKRTVNESVYTLQEAVRRQRPDARPMGGTGPS
jgi:membrane-associated HD superfamily phosphohydrolase